MTLTTTVMVMETTGALQLIVPLMLTVFFAKVRACVAALMLRVFFAKVCVWRRVVLFAPRARPSPPHTLHTTDRG